MRTYIVEFYNAEFGHFWSKDVEAENLDAAEEMGKVMAAAEENFGTDFYAAYGPVNL